MPGALLAALLACGGDEVRWTVIELRGTPVGWVEVRETADGVERARHLRTLEGGRPTDREGRLRTTHGPAGEVLRACRGHEDCWRAGDEPVWLPEDAPDGEPLLLDTWTLSSERVTVADGRFRFGGLDWHIGDGVVRAGPLTFREVPRRPSVPPVDAGRLLARAAPSMSVRVPRVARFRVDGVERAVRSPLPLELPPEERDIVERLAAADRGGDCKARARDAAEAARAMGLEARVVHGLAHVDGALAPHAWVEVTLPSGRVAVDPTLDQAVADATHLELSPVEVLTADVELLEAR